ncbi:MULTISPECIES: Hsp20/alpha crystallin family protein [Mesobacillus]|uniref:Hsp20/alpha crystallin family protein n=1 Tax=Mesobacillus selenatarsenatis TaxID=388741 RepID=A0A846T7E2_9BACI|nr:MULTISPECIES: Hsp20/alpha crystallin family protein [Mesobacillus]NKE04838.1 Hsp20/alpha crystallin family protein [Mesobacillus selenatarsenatis]
MATNHPDRPKRHEALEHWFKSMNQLMQEKPVKGILQSIDDFFRQPFPHSPFNVALNETEKEYIVKAELPGVKRDQISINIINNSLTILVNQTDVTSEINDIAKTERHMASTRQLSRTIPFSVPVNERKTRASYRDGLLEVKVAKKQGKKIDILPEHDG